MKAFGEFQFELKKSCWPLHTSSTLCSQSINITLVGPLSKQAAPFFEDKVKFKLSQNFFFYSTSTKLVVFSCRPKCHLYWRYFFKAQLLFVREPLSL